MKVSNKIFTGFGVHGSRLSHFWPVKPGWHLHINPLPFGMQWPIFIHYYDNINYKSRRRIFIKCLITGFGVQGSQISHLEPVKPGLQVHIKFDPIAVHWPPFWHFYWLFFISLNVNLLKKIVLLGLVGTDLVQHMLGLGMVDCTYTGIEFLMAYKYRFCTTEVKYFYFYETI